MIFSPEVKMCVAENQFFIRKFDCLSPVCKQGSLSKQWDNPCPIHQLNAMTPSLLQQLSKMCVSVSSVTPLCKCVGWREYWEHTNITHDSFQTTSRMSLGSSSDMASEGYCKWQTINFTVTATSSGNTQRSSTSRRTARALREIQMESKRGRNRWDEIHPLEKL